MLSKEATAFVEEMEAAGFRKAATRTSERIIPEIAEIPMSLCSDSWNSGCDHRILVEAGARLRLITAKDAKAMGFYGPNCDAVRGLWIDRFKYNF